MNTLIVYRTNHGCVEKCVGILAQRLSGNVEIKDLKNISNFNLNDYDSIIIGGSIYVGRIQKEVSDFCMKNIEILKTKKIGLFICGLQNDALETELDTSFPKELSENATAKECFGGEFIFKKASFMERIIIRILSKSGKDVLNISEAAIDSFANQMNEAS